MSPDIKPSGFVYDDDPYYAWLALNLGANARNNPKDTLNIIKATYNTFSDTQQESILG